MAYKSLFTVLTDEALIPQTLAPLCDLARLFEAHVEALCIGVDQTQAGYTYGGATALLMEESMKAARTDAIALEQKARQFLEKTELLWALNSGFTQLADLGRHVSSHARFADLVVLPKPYGENRGTDLETTTEAALLSSQAPILILPEDVEFSEKPRSITVAWNESSEALRAVKAALPLLVDADLVRLVIIDPPLHGPNRSDPGGRLSQFLARHGVRVEIDVLNKTQPRVSDILTRHALEHGSDMIVMGGYGHSRFREAVLGGATRNILETAPLPVFMAH